MKTRAQRRHDTKKYVNKQKRIHKLTYQHQCGESYEITPRMLGWWRNHSVYDCGKSQCQMCMNERRCKWNTLRAQRTLQENKSEDSYHEQLEDFYNNEGKEL